MCIRDSCYFLSYDETPGYAKLKFKREGWFFSLKFCYIILKNILAIASHAKYIEFRNQSSFQKYDVMVISWAFKKNFQKDGSFNDRYFKENSKDLPNSHWILISMDGYIPSNLNSNITMIKKKEGIFKYDFFSFHSHYSALYSHYIYNYINTFFRFVLTTIIHNISNIDFDSQTIS